MTERSTVAEKLQLGVESTPGTAVAANRRIRSFDLNPSPKLETSQRRASGGKFAHARIPGREWMDYSLNGVVDYTELTYLLNGALDTGAITTPGGGTNARTHTFTPDLSALDALKTFTIENGQAARAHEASFVRITELSMEFDRNTCVVSGSAQGQELTDGITLTPSPTDLTEMPVVPDQVSVYLDTTSGGLGGTKLTRAPKVKVKIGNRTGAVWALDAAQPSYVDQVELAADATVELTLMADATGMALVDDLRDRTRGFLRVHASHDDADSIESGVNHELQIDMAVDVADFQELGDLDGLVVCRFMLDIVGDTTWGKAIEVALTNDITAL